jgi:hypothetical protein
MTATLIAIAISTGISETAGIAILIWTTTATAIETIGIDSAAMTGGIVPTTSDGIGAVGTADMA